MVYLVPSITVLDLVNELPLDQRSVYDATVRLVFSRPDGAEPTYLICQLRGHRNAVGEMLLARPGGASQNLWCPIERCPAYGWADAFMPS